MWDLGLATHARSMCQIVYIILVQSEDFSYQIRYGLGKLSHHFFTLNKF